MLNPSETLVIKFVALKIFHTSGQENFSRMKSNFRNTIAFICNVPLRFCKGLSNNKTKSQHALILSVIHDENFASDVFENNIKPLHIFLVYLIKYLLNDSRELPSPLSYF